MVALAVDTTAILFVGMLVGHFLTGAISVEHQAAASAAGLLAALIATTTLGGYSTVVRFMTASSSFVFAIGALFGTLAWLLTAQIWAEVNPFAGILYWVAAFCLTFGSRFVLRETSRRFSDDSSDFMPVAIYGAGATGRQLAAYISSEGYYHPVAFLDDNPALFGLKVGGLRVYTPKQAATLIRTRRVKEVLLALPRASQKRRSEILLMLSESMVRVRTIPSLAEMLSGKARLDELRPVAIEDVLGRDPVMPEYALMRRNLRNRVVLVTGAGGSIGSELCRSILDQKPRALVLLDMSEHALFQIEQELFAKIRASGEAPIQLHSVLGSVENAALMRSVLQIYNVNTVFHAAAYKHVPLVELNVVEGVRNNVLGTKILLEAISQSAVSTFVMISTDKAVRPTNVMGASKRVAELLVQAAAQENSCSMSIVRFGNVLGSSGSVLPMFYSQIAAGGPITVTHRDITRFFMTIPEAAQLVIQAGALGEHGDVFHLDMGQPIRILDLARRLLRLHGLRERTPEQDGDVEISIVGLRPGEKLYEELLIDSDAKPTLHSRIFKAREKYLPREQLTPLVNKLLAACHIRDEAAVMTLLHDLVEGYDARAAQQNALGATADSDPLVLPFRTKTGHRSAGSGPLE